jgi:hypothetical protein
VIDLESIDDNQISIEVKQTLWRKFVGTWSGNMLMWGRIKIERLEQNGQRMSNKHSKI